MRFGIMAMQVNALIPSDLEMEDALKHLIGLDHAGLVEQLAEQGFNLVELGGDMSLFFPHTFSDPVIHQLARLKERLGLSYTLHLPLWSIEPSTPVSQVRKGSVEALAATIRAAKVLEPEVYVLHATGALAAEFYRVNLPEPAHTLLMRQFQNNAKDSIRFILQETQISPRQLAIETIEFPFEMTLELAETVDISICLDAGHVLVGFSGPVDLYEALEKCLPRLAEVHLHDGPWQGPERKIGYGKDHQTLGRGDLDVERFLDRLADANYQGPIVFELKVEEALESMDVIRSVRPDYLPAR
jgi:sugar phosphate isomerase/epimerase